MFGTYLIAQCKRIVKLFPAVMAATVILACCLGMLAAVLLKADAGQEKKQMVEIGLIGSTEGSYLGFGIQALQSLDSSRFAIAFPELESEEEAKKALEQGILSAYVLIPDGFVDGLAWGNNMQVIYVTSPGTTGIGSQIMEELVEVISDLITESQNAIYGARRVMREQGRQDISESTDRLYLRFLDLILGRELIYELEFTGVSAGLSVAEYCLCGTAVLFLLFWGIGAAPFLSRRDAAISRLLCVRGLSAGWQILAEYLAYVLLLMASFYGTAGLLGVAAETLNLAAVEDVFRGCGPGVLPGMLPMILLFAAMQLFLCEWIPDPVAGIPAQFLGAVGLGYLSGCFYPITFFPDRIQRLAPFLPTGAAVNYSGKLLLSRPVSGELGVMTVYGAGCLLAAALLRKRRLAR